MLQSGSLLCVEETEEEDEEKEKAEEEKEERSEQGEKDWFESESSSFLSMPRSRFQLYWIVREGWFVLHYCNAQTKARRRVEKPLEHLKLSNSLRIPSVKSSPDCF